MFQYNCPHKQFGNSYFRKRKNDTINSLAALRAFRSKFVGQIFEIDIVILRIVIFIILIRNRGFHPNFTLLIRDAVKIFRFFKEIWLEQIQKP